MPAVDRAPAGDHAVAVGSLLLHAEIGAAMGDEHVELLKGALVEQQLDPLARGQLALGVLRVDPLLAAAQPGLGAALFEFLENVFHVPAPLRFPWPEHTSDACALKRNCANLQIQQ